MRQLLRRAWHLLRQRQYDRDLAEELESHRTMLQDEFERKGLLASEAADASRRALGNVTLARENARDVWIWQWLETLWRDIAYAFRGVRRSPGFTIVTVVTLALGIGSTTVVFSVVHAVLVRPLPYRDVDRLVAVWAGHVTDQSLAKIFARYDDFEHWKRSSRAFEQLAAATWATGDRILTGRGPAKVVLAIPTTVDFFAVLGVSPRLGRPFDAGDLSRGCTVVLAHRFWLNTLAAPDIVGQNLALDDLACTVIGVMPERFAFYPEAADMWTLITPNREQLRTGADVGVFGRLAPGVTLEQAQSELKALYQQEHQNDAAALAFVPTVYPLHEEFTWLAGRNLRLTLVVLFAAVTVVLLIACVNVANLLLGRSVVRQREFAVRAALGAGRGRLIRQILTEGMLMSALAASVGVLLAVAGVRYFRALAPVDLPPGTVVSVNLDVLGFAILLAVSTAMVFGVLPAVRASRTGVTGMLKAAGHAVSHFGQVRMAGVLIVVQITCTTVLLVGAALLTQSIVRFGATPLGFRPDGLLMFSVRLPRTAYPTVDTRVGFHDRLLASLAAAPAVDGVALATTFVRGQGTSLLAIEGRPTPSPVTSAPDVGRDFVSADYFRVMGVPLRQGRWFDGADRSGAPNVAVVNEALVRKYFPAIDPVGQHIKYGTQADAPWLTVVGVVGNQKSRTVFQEMDWVEIPVVFRPISQTAASDATVLIRTEANPSSLGPTVQRIVAGFGPDAAVGDFQTMRGRIAKDLAYPQFRAVVLGAFAGLALLLAVVGLYAVLSQLVAHHSYEIGVRMALGAQRAQVLQLVLRRGLLLTGAGLVFGLAAAAAVTRYLQGMLFGLSALDPTTFVAVSMLFALAATLASYLPARRATRVDPLIALRAE